MSEESIPAPQYTLTEAMSVCLAMCHRALDEVRAITREPGPRGEPGPPGKDGERGAKGEPGRNAADLTFLQECINERIERTIKSASVSSPDGGRTLRWAIGDAVHEIKTAVVIDAGMWKEGNNYVPGDAVSSGNSLWIAKAATSTKPPSDHWRLAVRAGRDGKDYRGDEKRAVEPVKFK